MEKVSIHTCTYSTYTSVQYSDRYGGTHTTPLQSLHTIITRPYTEKNIMFGHWSFVVPLSRSHIRPHISGKMAGQKQLKRQSFVSQSSNSQDGSPHSEPSAKKRLVTLTTLEKDYDTLMWLCCEKSKEDGSLVDSGVKFVERLKRISGD